MKYSSIELKQMAETLIKAKKSNDPRYLEFIMSVFMVSGLTPVEIERKIREYAA